MYSVSTVFRLIQYKREGKQLYFHISRHIAHLGWETPVFFYTFYLVYIWHCRIKLFLRYLPNYPCSNFSRYVDLFQEISPKIAKQRQAEYFFFIEILTSILTIQSSISQFEFLFEQLFTITLFQCFHIQMFVVPFLRNNPSAVMFFQRFIFPAKTFREKYSERIWVCHCR